MEASAASWQSRDALRSQSLKRAPTIVDKLRRISTMKLSVVTRTDYKSGAGSPDVHAWLRLLSRSNASTEAGVLPEWRHELELAEAWTAAMATIVQEARSQEASDG